MAKDEGPRRPRNVEAEKCVLGSIMLDPDAYYSAAALLEPDDFFIRRNGWIFQAVANLHQEREPVDHLTVADKLRQKEQLDEAGGMPYLLELIERVPSAMHIMGYARLVHETAYQRRLLNSASEIAKVALKNDMTIDDRRVNARKAFDSADKGTMRPDALDAQEAAQRLYEQVGDWASNPLKDDEVRGLSTGLKDLDQMLDGIESGLYLVGGVQHTGKTAFCQQIAMNMAQEGHRVLMFSMEHTADYMYHRMASAKARLPMQEIRHGLDERELSRYYTYLDQISEWPIEVIGKQLTMTQIEAEIRARLRKNLRMVVIDNLEQASSSVSGSKEYIQLRRAAYWMLGIAQDDEVKLPIFTTMQIGTKKVAQRKNKRPEMDDLYGSDGPVQAASVVLLLHRPDRWTFNTKEHTNLLEASCWKDKVNFCGTGKGRQFVFGNEGQVWDKAVEELNLEVARA